MFNRRPSLRNFLLLVLLLSDPIISPIKRERAPGGEYGGKGGASEVLFPEGF